MSNLFGLVTFGALSQRFRLDEWWQNDALPLPFGQTNGTFVFSMCLQTALAVLSSLNACWRKVDRSHVWGPAIIRFGFRLSAGMAGTTRYWHSLSQLIMLE
jgi:hypothetical protein